MSTEPPGKNAFEQELPHGELFHYASADGLNGMVCNKTIWATNIEYLNDTAEFKHGAEVLRKIVESRKGHATGFRREFFDALDRHSSLFQSEDVFVMSLSEEGDLLSQWRGYTPSNSGFSIGFDARLLAKVAADLDGMHLVRCIYGEDEQREFAKSVLDSCLNLWINQREIEEQQKKDFRNMEALVAFNIYSTFIAASLKHHTFAEEKEWRLLGLFRQPERFRFRAGRSSLTPYIELKWGKETKAPDAQPIRSVYVGPCPDPKLAGK